MLWPCCTRCLSRMGTGECGPRHVFQQDQFYYWPAIMRVILEQLIGRPLLHLGCRHHVLELVLAGGCCFWSAHGTSFLFIYPSKEPEIPQFKRFHRQWALIDRKITTVLLLVITFHHSYHWLIDWLIEQGLTSPPTQYRLSGRPFYRSKDPTNSIKVLEEKMLQK